MCAQSLSPILCDPVDWSPPGSSVRGISQAGILQCVAISSSRGSSGPSDRTWVSCITGVGCSALLQGIFQTRDSTQVSHIAGKFFTV